MIPILIITYGKTWSSGNNSNNRNNICCDYITTATAAVVAATISYYSITSTTTTTNTKNTTSNEEKNQRQELSDVNWSPPSGFQEGFIEELGSPTFVGSCGGTWTKSWNNPAVEVKHTKTKWLIRNRNITSWSLVYHSSTPWDITSWLTTKTVGSLALLNSPRNISNHRHYRTWTVAQEGASQSIP